MAGRVGAEHPGFAMTPRELIDWTLREFSRPGTLGSSKRSSWIDIQPDFETAHFLNGFAHPDGKFRFKPDWRAPASRPACGPFGPVDDDAGTARTTGRSSRRRTTTHPFRLATSPARGFLNSTFNETPTSRNREGRPDRVDASRR